MTTSTKKVFASISNPNVSVSPIMYNAAFLALGLDCTYISLEISDLPSAMAGFRAMSFGGFSVSRPFKEAVVPYLDGVDEIASQIGAVNVIRNLEGRLVGYNSDWAGALSAVKPYIDLKGRTVVVVGAGGAGRAIAYGMKTSGATVWIFNRSRDRGERASATVGVAFGGDLTGLSNFRGADLVVNATPVGCMSEGNTAAIIPDSLVKQSSVVLDAVVLPLRTGLLDRALKSGASVAFGVEMLVNQGLVAFKHLTGLEAPAGVMISAMKSTIGDPDCVRQQARRRCS